MKWTPEEMEVYRETARRLREQDRPAERVRREKGWASARRAAELLKRDFHATRVVVFGSLARNGSFTQWSDVDVAAWGLAEHDTFRAIGAVMDLNTEIEINLVDVNTATPSLLATVEREGIEI